jgi:hypothetical protein
MIKLAQKSESEMAKILSSEKMQRENLQTTAFLKAIEETRKQQELALYDKEIDLAKNKGSGV